jgi:signal transduction histidine kinase
MHEEAQRLNRLLDDLRILSLAEAGELPLIKRVISPESILNRAAIAYDPKSKKQEIDLFVQLGQGLSDIVVDPDRMAQVMDNLLDNALNYTPSGGEITLRARMASKVSGTHPEKIRIEVQNSGLGIAPEELPYIFERFYRGDATRQRREQGGSGLGLAIARSMVEAHKGRIWAESERDQGVCFIVELPVG